MEKQQEAAVPSPLLLPGLCDDRGDGARRQLHDDDGARFSRRQRRPLSVAANGEAAAPSPGGIDGDGVSMILERHFPRGAC
ncbi:hypothetical protein SORBI_3008G116200 [Sorghum bicolor]|uniref:Uncharacterized protein n=1 Tax=Sorghum bicolor TaxID=4558 RepID=A0A1B6PD24_SORBI|nr:hypothetical protein SORBI_3008G116200 [Sorghum bicolor]